MSLIRFFPTRRSFRDFVSWAALFMLSALVLSAALSACSTLPAGSPTTAISPVQVIGQGYEGVILPPEAGPAFGLQDVTFWMPAEPDIQALEAGIEDYFGQLGLGPFGFKILDYKRQYVGIETGGQKLVYANFFCDSLGIDWVNEPVVIADGGSCYFQVRFNPATGEFTDLKFNGEA
ncbi:MAG TPA: hypothetical protein VLS48_02805 [Anaerolineales bacterium]|nr:hypothetical protein [Anaerolineales bacterium]